MSYLVLARKYRPQTFDEVIGQGHISRTLINAIISDRVAHAILFSGPRGTGKTTVARILAKAMNCKEGSTPSPCNQCQSCREIISGNAVDVFEIDGASNNSVDQVRELRENVKYMPVHSPYKIYIIDEVHMLSIAAFNALLKTLEEPPAHIMFLFATTEPHKIPVTILSRCQRHGFRRIGIDSIQRYMETICKKEGRKVSEESLFLIAQEAGGSMRDALSLLDQIMTSSEDSISAADVVDLLGATDRMLIFDLSKAVLARDVKDVLDTLDRAYKSGLDMKKLFADLVAHFRNLLVIKIEDNTHTLVDIPAYEIIQIKECVTDVTAGYLNQLFNLLLNEEGTVRFSAQPRLVIEMVLLRMCQIEPALSIDVLIKKLEDLRVEVSGGVKKHEGEDTGPANHGGGGNPPERHTGLTETNAPDDGKEVVAVENIERLWKRVVEIASDKHPMLAAVLTKCSLKALSEKGLEIIVNGSDFNMNLIQRSKNQAALEGIIQDILGKRVTLVFKAKKEKDPNNHRKRDNENRLRKEALSHPLVAETLDVFNGQIVDVKIL